METVTTPSQVALIFICVYPLMFGSLTSSLYFHALIKISSRWNVPVEDVNRFIEDSIPNAAIRTLFIALSAVEVLPDKIQPSLGYFTAFRITVAFAASLVLLISLFVPEINGQQPTIILLGIVVGIATAIIIWILKSSVAKFSKLYSK